MKKSRERRSGHHPEMNWLGDMLFNPPQSSRSERARRTGTVGVTATSPDQEVRTLNASVNKYSDTAHRLIPGL
jgi:hypothetical protein